MPPDPRDFSIILFLVLVAISGYLTILRTINGTSFALAIIASAGAVMLLRNADRLEQL